MPKAAVIIPARWGSTRFPGKALHPIHGKPLLQHVWERSSRARGIARVIVATDDLRIAEAAFAFGAEVALTSAKHRSGTDRAAEVAARLRGVKHVINVQGDEPLIDPALISKLAKTLSRDRTIEMVTAANVIVDKAEIANPNVVKVVLDRSADALYFSRSPIPFIRDGGGIPFLRHQGIYGYTTEFLLRFVKWKPGRLEQAEQLEQLRALENGVRIRVLLTKHLSIGVDTPADVAPVERLFPPAVTIKLTLFLLRIMKFIFVTGGVVSSLGKGLAAASLGTLLEHRGLKVALQKFDPYLNVDPGTMNPFQHGEVYVLDDGAETDLDLGHYERFTSCVLSRANSTSSGQVYETVLSRERKGDFLGNTVQVIPHITDEIKSRIHHLAAVQPCDVLITEIGGTTGDIEGLPFLEAIRQFVLEVGHENVIIMHVTLVPYIKAAGELKTKPSQQSIAKLREIGLQPQVLICRTEHPLDAEVRKKLSVFCNVPLDNVVEARDVSHTIYQMPLMLQKERLDDTVCRILSLNAPPPNMASWSRFVDRVVKPKKRVKIAVVGKYIELQDAYKSIYESLTHAAAAADCGIDLVRVDAEDVETADPGKLLEDVAGILVPGGFGDRGVEGKIRATQFAREQKVPFLGLCLGMQVATIEFARHVCGLDGANSTEFDREPRHPVICLLDTQRNVTEKGASMRLGTWPTIIREGTRAFEVYGRTEIRERHRHRYEFNLDYRAQMEAKGFVIAGTSPEGHLVEVIELKDHPWFLACQFHPEFQSKPNKPHPLFKGFVSACLANAD